MFSINRRTDYACRIILHLAMSSSDERVTAQVIAEQRRVPRALVRRVITQLANARLVTTTRGNAGGLALARPASEISLLDVVQAMEGPLAQNTCVVNPRECSLVKACPAHEAWAKARAALQAELGQITFDKLARRGKILAA
jgi:Rrf2 family protein